jgi:copper(I)-binding protein/cytochrome oxidase Cu insertion factor (SCO1/SenC/PrrC family)
MTKIMHWVLLGWIACLVTASAQASPWGRDYFPNVPLVTQDGEKVRFFDDLIEGKVVAINFIYTTCPDTCPLETAQLLKVQEILGERLGKDVFFYSITIDPETDSPEVLKEYKDRFGAQWTFLSGKEADIIELRRKLGLFVEEIQDGSNNHNVSMIIGNQATGRWMRRSPMENPYILADQLGNWLNDWRGPQRDADYANAPQLRKISSGEKLFRTRCATCHSVDGSEAGSALGPDLLGVTARREMSWLLAWLQAPDRMLAAKDPIAMELYEEYGQVAMPNMRLNRQEAGNLIEYLELETARVVARGERVGGLKVVEAGASRVSKPKSQPEISQPTGQVQSDDAEVAVVNAWVREADRRARMNAGYMTLVNPGNEDIRLLKVESEAFDYVEVHEMAKVDGLMEMRELPALLIPAHDRARLAPGGKHLMMSGPRRSLEKGERVELVLTFDTGRIQTVSLHVVAM